METRASNPSSSDDEQETPDVASGTASSEPVEASTTPGGDGEVQWEVVTKTSGLAPAEIIAQRLRSEGIPARAWQEGAGQAFGLTVGLLGDGYVMVPEPYLEQAKAILAEPVEDDSLDDQDE
jgi:hypothetical protein